MMVLNGDIIDTWQLRNQYWPQSHMQVIKQVASMLSRGVKVYYVTGNHDECLRRYENFILGDFHIVNKLVLQNHNGEKSWIFHGDIFDIANKNSKWLAGMGKTGYKLLLGLNRLVNNLYANLGKGRISRSKNIKLTSTSPEKSIKSFEETAAKIAIKKGYSNVICGHIHQPGKKQISSKAGTVTYLNSGDWVENLTALECIRDDWQLYKYSADPLVKELAESYYLDEATYLHTTELFKRMMQDFDIAS
jgi:UDP-2,3-diacylglucosamine pyrophosphatase LpxH